MGLGEREQVGVWLPRDIKPTADWKEFLANVSASTTDAAVKGPLEALSGGISSLVKLALSIKLELSAGEKAYYLSAMAFAWAVSYVNVKEHVPEEELLEILKNGVRVAGQDAREKGVFLPASFADEPVTLPLYRQLRELFLDELSTKANASIVTSTRHKIDAAFSSGLFAVWAAKPDVYKQIMDFINVPGRTGADMAMAWKAYRERLIYDFDVKAAFGQEQGRLSLGQLYIPLRATWKKAEEIEESHPYGEASPHTHRIGTLDELLDAWINDKTDSEWLRLIGGGPGSGKSTSLRALAKRIAIREDWLPLFIPLQHIDMSIDLRDSINNYFVDTVDSSFTQPPLTRGVVENGPPICLIFDGLDEIVAPGEAAREVVNDFASRLTRLLSSLDGRGERTIKVIVSGRLPAFQAAKKYLNPSINAALETRGYAPYRHDLPSAQTDLWKVDQRPIWWRNYARLIGISEDTPEALKNPKLSSLTNEPLLCYLLALSGYADDHWELAADNRNRIYRALIDSVYERGWGEGTQKRQGPGRSLPKADFHKLMETIALAAWLGGDARIASEESFDRAVEITGTRDIWTTFKEENGPDVANLAMNFYIKSSEIKQRGFEFTHKSFGEYLASRALLNIAISCVKESKRRTENALREWYRATNTGAITNELLVFLSDEARLRITDEVEGSEKTDFIEVKDELAKLITHVDQEGFPNEPSQQNWRVQESFQSNAEFALWALANSCARALCYTGSADKGLLRLTWNDQYHLSNLIKRLTRSDQTGTFCTMLSHTDMRNQSLVGVILSEADFEGALLSDAVFADVSLTNGGFTQADLSRARFYFSSFRNVSFADCAMNETTFQGVRIENCNFDITKDSAIVVSPLSLLSLDDLSLERLIGKMRLLASSQETKEEVVSIVEARMEALKSLPAEVMPSLVPDWDKISQDSNSDVQDEDALLEGDP